MWAFDKCFSKNRERGNKKGIISWRDLGKSLLISGNRSLCERVGAPLSPLLIVSCPLASLADLVFFSSMWNATYFSNSPYALSKWSFPWLPPTLLHPFQWHNSFFSCGVLTVFNSHFHITLCNIPVWCVISCMLTFPTNCKHHILLSFRFPVPGTGLGTPASAQSKCVEWITCTRGKAWNSKNSSFFVMMLLGKRV